MTTQKRGVQRPVAKKVTITKKTEAVLRETLPTLVLGTPLSLAITDILGRLDQAQSSGTTGLTTKRLLEILRPHRAIQEPGDVPWAQGIWARCQKTINRLGVTEEHAEVLGRWLSGQTNWNTVTLDMLTKNMETWLSKAHGLVASIKAPGVGGGKGRLGFTSEWKED
jgi:hypothetical protein